MTRLSVLTPSWQYGHFIADCLDSVQQQGVGELQHVVQDAASTDDTAAVVASRGGGSVTFASEADAGQSDALNRALRRADGEWIAWLNADEFYLPGGLDVLLAAAERTGADVVYGDAVFVDEDGRFNRLAPQHRWSRRVLAEYGCYISTCAALIRRDALGAEPWDVEARRRMDWDLFMQLATAGASFLHVPYPVGAFREHDERVTASAPSNWRDEDARLAVRYGQSSSHVERYRDGRAGRWLHSTLKAVDGAYLRQAVTRHLVGREMRWFATEQGRRSCEALLRRYGRRLPTLAGSPPRRTTDS